MHVSGIHVQHGVTNVSLQIVSSFPYILLRISFCNFIFYVLITFDTKKVCNVYGFIYYGNAALWHCIHERHFCWRERENKKLWYVPLLLPLPLPLLSTHPTSSHLLSHLLHAGVGMAAFMMGIILGALAIGMIGGGGHTARALYALFTISVSFESFISSFLYEFLHLLSFLPFVIYIFLMDAKVMLAVIVTFAFTENSKFFHDRHQRPFSFASSNPFQAIKMTLGTNSYITTLGMFLFLVFYYLILLFIYFFEQLSLLSPSRPLPSYFMSMLVGAKILMLLLVIVYGLNFVGMSDTSSTSFIYHCFIYLFIHSFIHLFIYLFLIIYIHFIYLFIYCLFILF